MLGNTSIDNETRKYDHKCTDSQHCVCGYMPCLLILVHRHVDTGCSNEILCISFLTYISVELQENTSIEMNEQVPRPCDCIYKNGNCG